MRRAGVRSGREPLVEGCSVSCAAGRAGRVAWTLAGDWPVGLQFRERDLKEWAMLSISDREPVPCEMGVTRAIAVRGETGTVPGRVEGSLIVGAVEPFIVEADKPGPGLNVEEVPRHRALRCRPRSCRNLCPVASKPVCAPPAVLSRGSAAWPRVVLHIEAARGAHAQRPQARPALACTLHAIGQASRIREVLFCLSRRTPFAY
jgi:hypothetical protein